MKLKPGDKIECINCWVYPDLIEHKIYKVLDTFQFQGYDYIVIIDGDGPKFYYRADLGFKLVFEINIKKNKRLLK